MGAWEGLWQPMPHHNVMLEGVELLMTVSPFLSSTKYFFPHLGSKSCCCSPCRAFFLALFKHLMFLEKRGCPRTALEFCKLILRWVPPPRVE